MNQHIQTNSSSWTDLSFTDQPNLPVSSGVRISSHTNCHHQLVQKANFINNIFRMFDLKVTLCFLKH